MGTVVIIVSVNDLVSKASALGPKAWCFCKLMHIMKDLSMK